MAAILLGDALSLSGVCQISEKDSSAHPGTVYGYSI